MTHSALCKSENKANKILDKHEIKRNYFELNKPIHKCT